MRIVLITTGLAALTGCFLFPGVADERERCDAYLDCVTAITPEAVAGAVILYGEESACWASKEDAARCAEACDTGRVALAEEDPVACPIDDVEVTPGSLMDEEIGWPQVSWEIGPDDTCSPAEAQAPLWTRPDGDVLEVELRLGGPVPLFFVCTPDGDAYACDDVDVGDFVFLDPTVTADAGLGEVVLAFDVETDDSGRCGHWTFTGTR